MTFEGISPELIFKKDDPDDPRLGNFLIPKQGTITDYVILGYPDDEGIRLNKGRPGASQAPNEIRKHLYKMTPTFLPAPTLSDWGNVPPSHSNIQSRHQQAEAAVSAALRENSKVLTLGGGHDYGFPDFKAFIEFALSKNKRPVILNFDAHLDVRPFLELPHSGTPFFRILEKYSSDILFFEIGIQDWCNSIEHLAWAKSKKAQIITLGDIFDSSKGLSQLMFHKVINQLTSKDMLAISIDIDGFASAGNPGASQIFPVGLSANDFLCFWRTLQKTFKPVLTGIYEVSPPYDHDGQTSKLAALIAHQFIF